MVNCFKFTIRICF